MRGYAWGSPQETFAFLKELLCPDYWARNSVFELETIFNNLPCEFQKYVSVDMCLARGADYYTGFIVEGFIPDVPVGAVLGGGRYDNLIEKFSGQSEPAVGMAFGLERILTAMNKLSMMTPHENESVLLYSGDQQHAGEACVVAHSLRMLGVKVNFCSQICDSATAVAYAKARDHSAIIAWAGNGKYSVSAPDDADNKLADKYRGLLHSVCG